MSSIARQAAADIARASEQDLGVAALYRRKDVPGDGVACKVCVNSVPARATRPPGASGVVAGDGQGTHNRTVWQVQVRGPSADELSAGVDPVSGVTPSGAIWMLRTGDVFVVDGAEVGRTPGTPVKLRVGQGIRSVPGGYMAAEVSL